MSIRITTEPLVEPISLIEAKLHLRVDTSADDALITQLIRASRVYCELYQGRAYISRTYEMTFDNGFPSAISVPNPPLNYVESITYVDADGDTQTVISTVYDVDTKSEPGRIYEAFEQTWPSDVRSIRNAVSVNFVAGYAAEFTVVTGTDVFTVSGRTFTNGDKVRLSNSGGTLPAGVTTDTDYFVISVSDNTFELSATSGGAKIDITADEGGGTHFIGEVPENVKAAMKLILAHLHEHREDTIEVTLMQIPSGAKTLLIQDRVQW